MKRNPDEKKSRVPSLNFRQKGGEPGSYHGSPFNQYKKIRHTHLTSNFSYGRFKALLEEVFARTQEEEDLSDITVEIFPVLVRENLIQYLTYKTDVLRWFHDYVQFRRGETEFDSNVPR